MAIDPDALALMRAAQDYYRRHCPRGPARWLVIVGDGSAPIGIPPSADAVCLPLPQEENPSPRRPEGR